MVVEELADVFNVDLNGLAVLSPVEKGQWVAEFVCVCVFRLCAESERDLCTLSGKRKYCNGLLRVLDVSDFSTHYC